MDKRGTYVQGKMFALWFFKIFILGLVILYVNGYILGSINVVDDTKNILFENFVSRAESCVEQNKNINNCFKNPGMIYGVRLFSEGKEEIVNAKMFKNKDVKCKKYHCESRELIINSKKYNLEVVYSA